MKLLSMMDPMQDEDGVDGRDLGGHPKHHPLLEGLQKQELQQQPLALAQRNVALGDRCLDMGEDPEEGEAEEAHGGLRRDGLGRLEPLGTAAMRPDDLRWQLGMPRRRRQQGVASAKVENREGESGKLTLRNHPQSYHGSYKMWRERPS